jgi:hypothetical protein
MKCIEAEIERIMMLRDGVLQALMNCRCYGHLAAQELW